MARSKTVRLDFSDRLEDPHRYVPKDHQQFTRFAEQVAKFLILDLSPIRAHQVYPLDSKLSGYVTVMEGLLRREDPMTRELILN